MPRTPDITIIGSGIVGLLTAREFSLAGASVSILEKNRLGRASSWAGGGILLPLYPWRQDQSITALILQSIALYPQLARQLTNDTGIDPEWSDCGLLITHNPDIDCAIHWCESNGIVYQQPTTAQLARFNVTSSNPLWLPAIAQARNPRLLKALIKDLKTRGVELVENCELQAVNHDNRHIRSIVTTSGPRAVNQLLLATGSWSGALWADLFPDNDTPAPDIFPVKGQMLLFDAIPDLLPHMVLTGDRYLIPRRDGKILAGSSVEACGFDQQPTAAAKEQLTRFALELLPELNKYPPVKHWAGLRPGTRHGIPYICKHPRFENLTINAGHFRNGLGMAPASARLLVDLVMNRPTALDPQPYALHTRH